MHLSMYVVPKYSSPHSSPHPSSPCVVRDQGRRSPSGYQAHAALPAARQHSIQYPRRGGGDNLLPSTSAVSTDPLVWVDWFWVSMVGFIPNLFCPPPT
jgi:hypothetical protein